MFNCNIEDLILDKDSNNKEIEKFFTSEVTQYICFKKVHLSTKFETIYNKIGKGRYSSPEIINEIKRRFNVYVSDINKEKARVYLANNPKPIKHPKPIKVMVEKPFKPKAISVRQKIWKLLREDETLSNKQLNEILNTNIGTVQTYAGIIRGRLSRLKELEIERKLKKKQDNELFKELREDLKEISSENRLQCRDYLFSILSNW